jgi:voltage-gated potassium channel
VRLGDLLRSPEDRDRRLKVVPLLLMHGDDAALTPDDDVVLEVGDQLLFAGHSSERRALESTLVVDSSAAYVLLDRRIPSSWVWRKLARAQVDPVDEGQRQPVESPPR